MSGKPKCLITAGATREYFDPVRYVSNPSTGKMGCSIASACVSAGWDTTLILCKSSALAAPKGARTLRVDTSSELLSVCKSEFLNCNILIMCAAVCDFKPKNFSPQKIKKDNMEMFVEFERTPDILKTLSKNKREGQILVGFAAETNDVLPYAKGKLAEKNLDCVVANRVGVENSGFASNTNRVCAVMRTGEIVDFGEGSKLNLSNKLVEFWEKRFF